MLIRWDSRAEFGPVHIHGQAQIQACPCTWIGPNMAMSMYRDMPEFGLVHIHGNGRIWPCPCTEMGPNSGMSLYMDRAIFWSTLVLREIGHWCCRRSV